MFRRCTRPPTATTVTNHGGGSKVASARGDGRRKLVGSPINRLGTIDETV